MTNRYAPSASGRREGAAFLEVRLQRRLRGRWQVCQSPLDYEAARDQSEGKRYRAVLTKVLTGWVVLDLRCGLQFASDRRHPRLGGRYIAKDLAAAADEELFVAKHFETRSAGKSAARPPPRSAHVGRFRTPPSFHRSHKRSVRKGPRAARRKSRCQEGPSDSRDCMVPADAFTARPPRLKMCVAGRHADADGFADRNHLHRDAVTSSQDVLGE